MANLKSINILLFGSLTFGIPEKTPVRVGTLQEGKLKVMKASRGQWVPYHVMLSKNDIKFCHPESLKLDPTLNISLESKLNLFSDIFKPTRSSFFRFN